MDFQGLNKYNQEVMIGYSNKDIIFMDGSSLQNGQNKCHQILEKSTLLMVTIFRHICMELYLYFDLFILMIKWYYLQWKFTMTTIQRITGTNHYPLLTKYLQPLSIKISIPLHMVRNYYKHALNPRFLRWTDCFRALKSSIAT